MSLLYPLRPSRLYHVSMYTMRRVRRSVWRQHTERPTQRQEAVGLALGRVSSFGHGHVTRVYRCIDPMRGMDPREQNEIHELNDSYET